MLERYTFLYTCPGIQSSCIYVPYLNMDNLTVSIMYIYTKDIRIRVPLFPIFRGSALCW